MSRKVDPGACLRLPWILATALWQTWWRRPQRRPVMAGIVLVPIALALAMMAMPGQTRSSRLQAASPSPGAPPAPGGASGAPGAAPPRGVADSTAFRSKNPFKIRVNRVPDAPPPTPPPPELPRPIPSTPPPRMDDKLRLLGTFLMGNDRWAILFLVSKAREDVFKEGEAPITNSRIVAIEPRKVRLIVDNHEVTLEIDYSDWGGRGGGQQAAAPPPAQPGYQPPPPEQLAPVPAAPPEGQPRRLARAEVDGYLDNLNTLLTQVNIQPVFQAGQPAGFRLTDIQKGTILDQIGVTDGDTLRFVNGQRIDSVQSAFQLYNILKESTNVEITVIRNTRPVTLRYLIY